MCKIIYQKFIKILKRFLYKIRPRFSFHYIAYTFLVFLVVFSLIRLVFAVAPNPGHEWSEVGDGPLTVARGGTNLTTIADKTLFVTTALDTVGTLTIPAGQSIRRNALDTAFEAFTPGTGTVTTVSVTTANGISGSVATATTTPAITLTLGAITPSTVNGLTLTSNATGFAVAGGTTSKTLTVSNTLTLAGTDSTTMTFPSTSATIARTDAAQTFTGTQTFSSTISGSINGTASKATNLVGGNSTTLLGSIPYQSNTDTTTLLAPNTTTTKKFLRMTGTGTNGAVPAWDTLIAGDIPALSYLPISGGTLTGNLLFNDGYNIGSDSSRRPENGYFKVSLVSPFLVGGIDTTSDLSLQTTTGVGTTGADMHFLVGNNGATEAMTILNSGNVGIKNTSPSALLTLGTAGTTAGTLSLAGLTSGTTILAVPAIAGSYTFTLPANGGTNGYVLSTNGSGTTSWVAAGSGGMVYPGTGIANSTGSSWGTSYTTSGSGTELALTTSPTFITSLTSPLVIGGTTTTSGLTLKTTTGVGTTGADIHFLVGNNGATEAMTILNSGDVSINRGYFGVGNLTPTHTIDALGNFKFAISTETSNDFEVYDNVGGKSLLRFDNETGQTLFESNNVAIGQSTAPTHKLHVNGSVQIGDAFSYTPSYLDFVVGSSTMSSRFLFGQSNSYYGGMVWNYNATPANAYLSIGYMNGTSTAGFNMLQSGYTGLGITAPTYKFDVRGTAAADGIRTAMGLDLYPVPDPIAPTCTMDTGGSVTAGNHWYGVTYTTALGETHIVYTAAVVTVVAGTQTVTVNIPVSADPRVTGRKVYKTIAGDQQYQEYLLATIGNNTDVTYIDTAADEASPTKGVAYFRINSTSSYITVGGIKAMVSDLKLTAFGIRAGNAVTTGGRNSYYGSDAGRLATTGNDNSVFGYQAGYAISTGGSNSIFGSYAGAAQTTTSSNAFFGYQAGFASTGGTNSAFGRYALRNNVAGGNNTVVGTSAGSFLSDDTTPVTVLWNSTLIGAYAYPKHHTSGNNEIVIGYRAIGEGANTAIIGNSSLLRTYLTGVNLKAGTATDGTAPLKFTSGTNLGTAEAGAMEFDGTNLYFTPSTTRKTVAFLESPSFTTPILGVASATSVNGLTLTSNTTGFAIAGGTTPKTLTISNTLTFSGTDGSSLNIGAGGSLGTGAFATIANYLPLAGGAMTSNLTLNTQSDLRFADSDSSNWVAFQAPATVASDVTWTLPSADASGCFKSDGAGAVSIGACGDTNTQTFSSNGDFTMPTNALMVIVESWGGGGGGGGGYGGAVGTVRSGGAGGGGGAYVMSTISASDIGSAGTVVKVTIGLAGTAGAGGATNPADGGVGGRTCFSTTTNCAGTMYVSAYGGGGGNGGSGATGSGGGGGGGSQTNGLTNATQATGGAGGYPLYTGGGGGASAGTGSTVGTSAYFGGGGGGNTTSAGGANSGSGGGSYKGGSGGGGGGTIATSYTLRAGGAGGSRFTQYGSGGVAGSTEGESGTAGSAGGVAGGYGGGGGATGSAVAGGAGGNGGAMGGGGGGGGASNTTSGGAGGAGGLGYLKAFTLRGAGADLAEVYGATDESLTSGDVVALNPDMTAGVMKTTKAYEVGAVGVISTSPGLIIGDVEDAGARPVMVALSGRVPVKVSLENGPIKKGDYLTPSNTPGVAMRATKAGIIIGQAMTEYSNPDDPSFIVAFIKSGPSNGVKLKQIIPGLTLESTPGENTAGDVEVIEDGGDNTENTDETEEVITPTETIQKIALKYFLANKIELEQATDISEIYTDRLSAALEIITPTVITDTVSTNSIVVSTGEVISFNSPSEFIIPPLFNQDTAGFAIIKKGDKRVQVTYNEPYISEPIVSADLSFSVLDGITDIFAEDIFSEDVKSMIIDSDQNGFTILINKNAPRDLRFSWTAFSVKDPKVFESVVDGLVFEEPNKENDDESTVEENINEGSEIPENTVDTQNETTTENPPPLEVIEVLDNTTDSKLEIPKEEKTEEETKKEELPSSDKDISGENITTEVL